MAIRKFPANRGLMAKTSINGRSSIAKLDCRRIHITYCGWFTPTVSRTCPLSPTHGILTEKLAHHGILEHCDAVGAALVFSIQDNRRVGAKSGFIVVGY